MKQSLLQGVAAVALMTSLTLQAAYAEQLPIVVAQAKTTEATEPKAEEDVAKTKAEKKAARKAAKKAERKAAKKAAKQAEEEAAPKGDDADAEATNVKKKAKKAQEAEADEAKAEGDAAAKNSDTKNAEADAVPKQAEEKEEPVKAESKPATKKAKEVAQEPKAEEETAPAKTAESGSDDEDAKKAEREAAKKAEAEAELSASPPTEAEKEEAREATVGGADPTKKAAAIVKDDLSAEQKASLQAAERERRRAKRKERKKLLGAFAVGAAVGAVVNELGGRVVEDQGDRIVVERDGNYIIRKDENDLFRGNDARIEDEVLENGRLRTTVYRPNGSQIVTIRDTDGTINRRFRVRPDGKRVMLIDNRAERPRVRRDYRRELGELRLEIDRDEYIVESRRADRRAIRQAFVAEPVERVERAYSLSEVRQSSRLREKMRRVDLDTITFPTGVFSLSQSQVDRLADVAGAIDDVIKENPREIFLIEGHTDAVGDDISNLTLSDRRADTVAQILTTTFGLPPENFVVQGYGEANLKVKTNEEERANRRVTVRRITPLINTASR